MHDKQRFLEAASRTMATLLHELQQRWALECGKETRSCLNAQSMAEGTYAGEHAGRQCAGKHTDVCRERRGRSQGDMSDYMCGEAVA